MASEGTYKITLYNKKIVVKLFHDKILLFTYYM